MKHLLVIQVYLIYLCFLNPIFIKAEKYSSKIRHNKFANYPNYPRFDRDEVYSPMKNTEEDFVDSLLNNSNHSSGVTVFLGTTVGLCIVFVLYILYRHNRQVNNLGENNILHKTKNVVDEMFQFQWPIFTKIKSYFINNSNKGNEENEMSLKVINVDNECEEERLIIKSNDNRSSSGIGGRSLSDSIIIAGESTETSEDDDELLRSESYPSITFEMSNDVWSYSYETSASSTRKSSIYERKSSAELLSYSFHEIKPAIEFSASLIDSTDVVGEKTLSMTATSTKQKLEKEFLRLTSLPKRRRTAKNPTSTPVKKTNSTASSMKLSTPTKKINRHRQGFDGKPPILSKKLSKSQVKHLLKSSGDRNFDKKMQLPTSSKVNVTDVTKSNLKSIGDGDENTDRV